MSSAPVKRKLAAILAADAVGYSRMMAADEEGTLRILAAHRAVIDGIIQFHDGRIVNTAGDSVLAEFASPTQAVRCAVEIQDALKTRNDTLPEDRRLQFRIGVNLGDVMVKGEDLLGDGINVAARLESIAEPGNICVSSSVYDQIAGKLDLGFVDLGEQRLKNIERPVRAYRVERDAGRARRAARRRRRGAPWLAIGLGVAVLGAGAAWYWTQQSEVRRIEEASAKAAADAAKARAEAEIARARAEAEEARKAALAASDAAAASKRALEEQRAAEERARSQRELAAARAEAEATRRRADAELATAAARRAQEEQRAADAEAARRKAEREQAAAKPPAAAASLSYDGSWAGAMRCLGAATTSATGVPLAVTASGTGFEVRRGESGQPGWLQMTGIVQADGSLQLAGTGVSRLPDSFGKTFTAGVRGMLAEGKYEGSGRVGAYDCTVTFERATAARAQAVAAAASAPPGAANAREARWSARFTCEAFKRQPERTYPAAVSLTGNEFSVHRGQDEQPGSIRLKGVRETDGTLRLSGHAYHPVTGQRNRGEFEGRFAGERYEGNGRLGNRNCALTISRR
jgi:class 3 adenylate cyclase